MAARMSGNKLVAVAVGATVTVVGLSAVYVPFFADRDKLRGLHEESAPPTSAMLAQEIRKLQSEGILKGDDEAAQDHKTEVPGAATTKAPGSMWSKFKKS